MPKKLKNKTAPLESELARTLADFSTRKTYLVGVSGGRDSMALLHALVAIGYKNLVVCHLDHGLRGKSSRADANLVLRTAKKLHLDLETARARTKEYAARNKKSLELAARDLRHAFFKECSRRRGCRRLMLAHHADDQIETCLFHFLRGSGAAGLAGMRQVTKWRTLQIIRPLLGVTRDEIKSYVRENVIVFREDATNASSAHTRNRIRHQIIPAITRSFGSSFQTAILRASEILRHEDDWLESQIPKVSKTLSCISIRGMMPAIRHRTILRWLRRNGVPEPGFLETRRVLSLLDVENGPAKVSLPGNRHARRRKGEIFIGREKL